MKLLSLNIWGGRVHDPLISFIKDRAVDTDIFCFQEVYRTTANVQIVGEVYANIYEEIEKTLSDHSGHFAVAEEKRSDIGITDFDLEYGLATFTRKSLETKTHDHFFVHKHLGAERSEMGFSGARLLLRNSFEKDGKTFSIANFHGLHNGLGKTDSDERLVQSKNIKEFLNQINTPKILCGDFNLLPDTKSIAILEEGMRNLIKEYEITSTRSSFYPKETKFADYVLVSPDIEVLDFKVLQNEVSDHLPLLLEFQ